MIGRREGGCEGREGVVEEGREVGCGEGGGITSFLCELPEGVVCKQQDLRRERGTVHAESSVN